MFFSHFNGFFNGEYKFFYDLSVFKQILIVCDKNQLVVIRNPMFFKREIIGLDPFKKQLINFIVPKCTYNSVNTSREKGRRNVEANANQFIIVFCVNI